MASSAPPGHGKETQRGAAGKSSGIDSTVNSKALYEFLTCNRGSARRKNIDPICYEMDWDFYREWPSFVTTY